MRVLGLSVGADTIVPILVGIAVAALILLASISSLALAVGLFAIVTLAVASSLGYSSHQVALDRLDLRHRRHAARQLRWAISQIGGDDPTSQVAGVYALQSLAADSLVIPSYVVRVLSAFLRGRGRTSETGSLNGLQAALSVIGQFRQAEPGGAALTIDFTQLNLSGLQFDSMDYSYCNFTDADLKGASLFASRLTGAVFSHADLTGANLAGASLDHAFLVETVLAKAILIGANLHEANLIQATLQTANLQNAVLSAATLVGADLRKANLTNADLTGADLDSAQLEGAALGGARLFQAELEYAIVRPEDLQGADIRGARLPRSFPKAMLDEAHEGGDHN